MSESRNLDTPETPEERRQRRRARRWKRRGRTVAPFIGVSLLVATLALSVDLIEYQPQKKVDRLSDRPLPTALVEKQKSRSLSVAPSISNASVVNARPLDSEISASGLDVTLVPGEGERDLQIPPR